MVHLGLLIVLLRRGSIQWIHVDFLLDRLDFFGTFRLYWLAFLFKGCSVVLLFLLVRIAVKDEQFAALEARNFPHGRISVLVRQKAGSRALFELI